MFYLLWCSKLLERLTEHLISVSFFAAHTSPGGHQLWQLLSSWCLDIWVFVTLRSDYLSLTHGVPVLYVIFSFIFGSCSKETWSLISSSRIKAWKHHRTDIILSYYWSFLCGLCSVYLLVICLFPVPLLLSISLFTSIFVTWQAQAGTSITIRVLVVKCSCEAAEFPLWFSHWGNPDLLWYRYSLISYTNQEELKNSVLCAYDQSSLITSVASPATPELPELLPCPEPVEGSKSQSAGVGPLLHVGRISWSDQLLWSFLLSTWMLLLLLVLY